MIAPTFRSLSAVTLTALLALSPVLLSAEILNSDRTGEENSVRSVDRQVSELNLDAAALEHNAQLKRLNFDGKNGLIELESTVLVEDDAPGIGVPEGYNSYRRGPVEWVEDLKDGVVIQKNLQIDRLSANSARLVFQGFEVMENTSPLHITVNGEKIIRPSSRYAYPEATQYIDWEWDRWYYVDVPAGMLREGENEIRMWAESDSTSWRILIAHADEFARGSLTRTTHPNRSMKSNDGGRTWSDSRLGALDAIDGEYAIRLSIDQHLPSGEYISRIFDLVDGDEVLKRNAADLRIDLDADLVQPESTRADLYVRFGSTPFVGDDSWSDWQEAGSIRDYPVGERRYMQLRAELETDDPQFSPAIRNVSVEASWEDRSPNPGRVLAANVIHNGEIIRSSYGFSYEDLAHPGLSEFRTNHRLDQYVGIPASEFDLMMTLLNWAYRIPLAHEGYSWDWNEVTVIEMSEGGMPLLGGPFEGRRMVGMCLYPNQAFIGALLSMGHQARHVNLHSEDLVGHEAIEVWSNEYNKWIYMDATRDYYYFDPETGEPLNLLEIHNLLAEQMPEPEDWRRPFGDRIGNEVVSRIDVGMREGVNDFSIEEDGRRLLRIMGHFRIIPRNDFLSNPLPVPVRTGATMWGWHGFLNWYDDIFPKREEYQTQTNRPTDFYEPLNQAKVFLNETDQPGLLRVDVDTYVPGGMDDLLVRVNGDEWETAGGDVSWYWSLNSGRNTIEVRTRNVSGVLGPVSHIDVSYNP